MSITVNGQSCVPPGFRFHPTEEELLNYYLRKKVASEKIDLDVIRDVDLNKLEPWDIQEKCRIGWTPQNDWYFFSHKDKKYPTGTRTNRATVAGFWKATGRDKVICTSSKRIGMRKTLVFYKGRAPHGQKSDWIMHEYRLDDPSDYSNGSFSSTGDASAQEDGWVVCRVFKKKNFHNAMNSPNNNCSSSSSFTCDVDVEKTQLLRNCSGDGDGTLDQIFHDQYTGRSCKQETEAMISNVISQTTRHLRPIETVVPGAGFSRRFMKLPALDSPTLLSLAAAAAADFPIGTTDISCFDKSSYQPAGGSIHAAEVDANRDYHPEPSLNDWTVLDRLAASHLNGQSDAYDNEFVFSESLEGCDSGDGGGNDLWSLASYASDHNISRVSHGSI